MTFGSPLLRSILLVCALSATPFLASAPAHADLRVCNESANLISISLGYRAERGWQSEGWWQAPPGDCRVLFQGELDRRYYYVFAADDVAGGEWGGQVFMCTRDESFTIFGVEDCLARGYERTGFFEIDTQGRTDWTLQLTDRDGNREVIGPDADEDLEEPLLLVDPETGEPEPSPTEGTESQ
jgi:uncharacterized membrane protein